MYRTRFAPKYLASMFGLGLVLVLLAALQTGISAPLPSLKEAYSARSGPGGAGAPGTSHIAPSAVMTNGWTNLFPNLLAVSAISSTEAWASGEYGHLIHYVDGSWTAVDPPLMQGVDLIDISMASTNAGWIAAQDKAYQYDGTTWNERSTGLGNGLSLQRVSALALNDAWGITSGPYCGSFSQIVHWDGNQWSPMLPPNTPYDLMDLKIASTSDGWSVGYSCTTFGPVVLHYDGSTWSQVQVPSDPTLIDFSDLSVTGPNDIWTIGNPYNNTRRAVYHYSGGVWASWLLPQGTIPWGIYMADDNDGWVVTDQNIWHWDGQNWSIDYSGRYFLGVSGAGGQAWAVGLTDLVLGRALTSQWTQQWGGPTGQQLNHVSTLSTDEAWVVGNSGTIMRYTGGSWQALTSTISADLYGVQMLSPGDGYAVGGIHNSNGVLAHWDGVTWQQVMTTATPLHSVFMVKSNEGWAVGEGGAIWHGAGSTWSQVASPTTYSLYDVAMDSPSHGWAVGGYTFGRQSLAVLLEYDGTQWVDHTGSLPSGVPFLNDLTLASGGAEGWAVGGPSGPNSFGPGVVLHLSGGVWAVDAQPPPVLFGVASDSEDTAWAVGSSSEAYYHSGGAWRAVQLPIGYTYPFGPSIPYGVAMVTGEIGWAVGTHGMILQYTPPGPPASSTPTSTSTSTSTTTVASATPAVTSPTPSGPTWTATSLPSSSTSSPTPTTLVTTTATATTTNTSTPTTTPSSSSTTIASPISTQTAVQPTATLTRTSTSTPTSGPYTSTPTVGPTCGPDWTMVSVPRVGSGNNELSSVVSLAADNIWAVGGYEDGQFVYSLALHWDGNQWSSVAVPNYGGYSNDLTSVAASAPDDVWAAGWYYDIQTHNYKGLVVHWNGSQWTVATHLDLGPQDLNLHAVTAITTNDVWIVGDFALSESVAFHWDGQAWALVTTPNPGTAINRLSGVAALSSTNVWAVGDYDNNPGQYSLIVHWDGTQWSQVTGPAVPPGNQLLNSVATISPNDIWAVGYYCAVECGPGHPDETFAIHWDGTQWTRVTTPTGTDGSFLLSVTAVSSTEVWAVGFGMSAPTAIIERWDGSQWSLISSPVSGNLYGVSAVSASNVWIVGNYFDQPSGLQLSLVEHYNLCPTATPSATSTAPPTHSATSVPSSVTTVTPTTTSIATTTGSTTTSTPTNLPTGTSTPGSSLTNTNTPTPVLPTPTSCTLTFSDVPPGSTFYPYIHCLACRGIINGYADGTFKPNNDVTRGQLSKIVANAAGFSDAQPNQMFQDVPVGSTFQVYIGRLASRGYINGYACGGTGEPCVPPANLPYFRPGNNATRGQISKIDANAAGFNDPPSGQQFEDVPVGSTYYTYTYRLVSRGVMSGYQCGGVEEPCVPPGNLPYFRPNNNATRGQTSKIVGNTFFPECAP